MVDAPQKEARPHPIGKLDEIRKTFKAKSAKSARSLEFACLQIAQVVSRAALEEEFLAMVGYFRDICRMSNVSYLDKL
jgi:hypothetical protein